ncbi:MAG TPA: phosphate/phosphite/phosphonate ABC transporter substrate-binding protein [Candidatus Binatia bacterium]|jgi:phosphonate transport system substrate-binding protein|nr:phosphate/phosphite/phosphonate ABC transporter substrate-binding protein [Candidatus Binatia bacterium]
MFVTRQTRRLAFAYAIAALLFDITLGSHVMGQTPGGVEAKTITLGIVAPMNQKEVEEHFRDFVRYVARKLSSASAIEGRIVVAPTQSGLANLLTEQKVDFYMESPYPTYLINNVYGAGKLLLRRWKGGMAEYHALIFTKKNSETRRLEDLRGKIIAFEDPGSTSGHFLPKFFLSRRGFKLSEKTRIEPNVSPGEVGYIFVYSRDKIVDLVLIKSVAAGAFSNDDYATLDERKKSDITILAETDRLPRHLLSIRRDLAPVLVNRLEKLLLSMHQDPEGRLILQRTDGTTKFDALPGGELAMRQRLLDTFYSPEKK